MLFAKMFARQAVRACTASSMTGRVNRTNIVVAARRMNQTSTNEGAQTSSHARPRAVGVDMGKKRSGVLRFAVAGGLAAGILAIGYQNDFSWEKVVKRVKDLISAMTDPETGDPAIEDLQRALGPAPPPGYLSVIIAAEDVLLHREWNRNYGWLYQPRAGVKQLLKALTDPANPVMLSLWSENTSIVAGEITEKLLQEVGGPPAHTPPLSLDHIFIRPGADGNKRKEKRLEYLNRDLRSVLLVDKDGVSEQLNPANTILVTPMTDPGASTDTTCAAIKAVVQRIKDDSALSGVVNVPRTLSNLRAEAESAGYRTDAAGLHSYLSATAEEEEAKEIERREAGLGGLMRRTAQSSAVLRSKLTTGEAALLREYKDPSIELGRDALLATKVREATARMFGR